MKKFLIFILIVLSLATMTSATTYIKFWADGLESESMIQGAVFAWEYDVSIPGGSAMFSIYLDIDQSHSVSEADKLLIEFEQQDGYTGNDGPPSDSSSTEDGLIYCNIGVFGFAPADYLFHITDLNNSSEVNGTIRIYALPEAKTWCNGTVTMEGVSAPDPRLKNIMVEATDEQNGAGMWSALTDEYGAYSINLPDNATTVFWEIQFSFSDNYQSHVIVPQKYEHITVTEGINGPYDFNLENIKSFVYGSVYNEFDEKVLIQDYGSLENLYSGMRSDFQIVDGSFRAPAVFEGNDTINVPFMLQIWGNGFRPFYMAPPTWNEKYQVILSKGDSAEKNIKVYGTDTAIYVTVTMDGGYPDRSFIVRASHDSIGHNWINTDEEGSGTIAVRSGYTYNVNLETQQDGENLLPPGYFVENGSWRQGEVGEHVVFNLVKGTSVLAGRLTFSSGDAVSFNPSNSHVDAYLQVGGGYTGEINVDSMNYRIDVPNGLFSVQYQNWPQDYLAKPHRYENISVTGATVDTLDFELNYAHAQLVIRLKGLPPDYRDRLSWHNATTTGEYPQIYWTNSEINSDTCFVFRVCDGEWMVFAPYLGTEYSVDNPSVIVNVANDSAYYYAEFQYTHITGIQESSRTPHQFYLSNNFPNPFNPVTTIEFGLPERMPVQIDIFDIDGRLVENLLDDYLSAGLHRFKWQAGSHSTGIYFCRVSIPGKSLLTRMLLIK